MAAVPGPGVVGNGFERQRLVVALVEGELPGGLLVRAQGVGAQGDAADPGALEPEGVVQLVGSAGQQHCVVGGFGQGESLHFTTFAT
ncbi:hypothetical protein ACIA6D_40660 [Streptomyces cacaoi]|uniref:hypothetical protein n=1 Tax=Streptomyces cacaoi TaxID=1898 RepID=UPI00374A13CE